MSKSNRNLAIKWFFNILVPLLIVLLIPVREGGVTIEIRTFLAITAAFVMMIAMDNINYFIPVVLLPFIYVLFKVAPASLAFKPWQQSTVWMALCVFVLGNTLMRTGLLPRITYWLVIKLGGTYKGMVWGFTFAGFVACALVAGANSLILPLAFIIYGVVEALGLKQKKAATGLFCAGIFGVSSASMFIYSANNISVMFDATSELVAMPSYVQFFLMNAIFVPVLFLCPILIIKALKPEGDFATLEYFKQKRADLGPMTTEEKKVAVIIVLMLLYFVTANLHKLDLAYGFLFSTALCFIPGINVGKMEDVTKANFGRVIFLASCICIGNVAGSLGLGELIVNAVAPSLVGVSPFVLVGVVFLIAFAINFILTPLAAMAAFSMPLANLAVALGINPGIIFFTFFQGVDNLIMPYERSVIAAIFALDGMRLKDFVKINALKSLLVFVYILALGVPYWLITGHLYL